MPRSLALLVLAACAPSWDLGSTASTTDDPSVRLGAPLMDTFPVAAPHNIGYDHASCGTGTCATSCTGDHANSDWGGAHHGIDVFAYHGAPLVAVADGIVRRVGVVSATSGLRVRLRDAAGWEYYYGHLDEAVVQPGDVVRAGDLLGTMGRSGTSSTHLHFNISPNGAYSDDIDPFPLLDATSSSACEPIEEAPPDDSPVPTCSLLQGGAQLAADDTLWSCDDRFVLVQQDDGNLVLYAGDQALWHAGTHGNPGAEAVLQDDGNLVVYGTDGVALWHAATHGNPGARLDLQDDGNLVVYGADGQALWHTGTHGH